MKYPARVILTLSDDSRLTIDLKDVTYNKDKYRFEATIYIPDDFVENNNHYRSIEVIGVEKEDKKFWGITEKDLIELIDKRILDNIAGEMLRPYK